jgi:hypothetical protein
VSPLLTSPATDRVRARSSARGGTMPLGDTLPLRDLSPPADAPGMPTRPSTRIRRDTRAEVEVVRRRRSQTALAAVLGLLFVALLSGVVAALASRQEGAPAIEAPPARTAEPPAVQVTATAPAAEPAAVPAAEPQPAAPQLADPAAEPPPPSVSAAAPPAPAPRPARARPVRNPGGVGAKGGSGENAPPGNDLLDPYGPTGR